MVSSAFAVVSACAAVVWGAAVVAVELLAPLLQAAKETAAWKHTATRLKIFFFILMILLFFVLTIRLLCRKEEGKSLQ